MPHRLKQAETARATKSHEHVGKVHFQLPQQTGWPDLDVSIVTFNSARWLPAFFESVLRQDYPLEKIRILVTDNGSTDDTLGQLQQFQSRCGPMFKGFRIASQGNEGFGAGHNRNLADSRAELFLVSNVDLEFESDSLCNAVRTAGHSEPDVASWEYRQKPFEHPKYYNPVTLETVWSSSACVLFRTDCLRQVGGYDTKLFLYGEDVELSYRLRDHGFRLLYCPKAVCWHYTYADEQEVKPAQFFGSTLANLLIRLRYGSLSNILAVPWMYLSLFLLPTGRQNKRELLLSGWRLLCKAPHFLFRRCRSSRVFPIQGWDYETTRDGAFYRQPKFQPTEWPLVSVIVRTYDGRIGYLKEAVQSVLNQTYPNIELVVVEDGETNFAREYLDSCGKRSPVRIVYKTIPKAGRCQSGNTGLATASGTYFVFLDDDDLFFADHLETLVTRLQQQPQYAAAYATAWDVPTRVISTDPLRYEQRSPSVMYCQPFCRPLLWIRNYMPIQTVLFHRRLYDVYGGFDEELQLLEDWNLWTRYAMYDDFVLVEKTTSLYRTPPDARSAQQWHEKMNRYYDRAIEKQKDLRLSLTAREFVEMYRLVQRYESRGVVAVLRIRSFAKSRPYLAAIFRMARRVAFRVLRLFEPGKGGHDDKDVVLLLCRKESGR